MKISIKGGALRWPNVIMGHKKFLDTNGVMRHVVVATKIAPNLCNVLSIQGVVCLEGAVGYARVGSTPTFGTIFFI